MTNTCSSCDRALAMTPHVATTTHTRAAYSLTFDDHCIITLQ